MHEVSLATDALDLIEAAAQRHGFTRVRQIRFEVGDLSCVDVDALEVAIRSAGLGTCAEGATLDVLRIAGEGRCSQCQVTVPVSQDPQLCPVCEQWPLEVTSGTQLRVKDLLVE